MWCYFDKSDPFFWDSIIVRNNNNNIVISNPNYYQNYNLLPTNSYKPVIFFQESFKVTPPIHAQNLSVRINTYRQPIDKATPTREKNHVYSACAIGYWFGCSGQWTTFSARKFQHRMSHRWVDVVPLKHRRPLEWKEVQKSVVVYFIVGTVI